MSNVINDIKGVPQTFSSWDSCMSKAYCKWPAIVGIIIASIIVLSLLWCVASCLCCGASLCASCMRCITCFGCCGACKSGGGGGRRRSGKEDYAQMPPTPYNGYQPQPSPMVYQPQFAQFDTPSKSAKVHADSLPAMPTWGTATNRRVEDHSEPATGYGRDVEMGTMATASPRTHRGGYSSVPNAGPSPIPQQAHFQGQQHGYNSDIGAQRIPQHDDRPYDDFDRVPLSPAPTYATNPPVLAVNTDRFASGGMSPTPREYHQQQQPHYQTHRGIAPSPYSPPSTIYEASDYNSYPQQNHHHQQQQQQQQQYSQQQYQGFDFGADISTPQSTSSQRPPSLLQIGRKPVVGSHREV